MPGIAESVDESFAEMTTAAGDEIAHVDRIKVRNHSIAEWKPGVEPEFFEYNQGRGWAIWTGGPRNPQ